MVARQLEMWTLWPGQARALGSHNQTQTWDGDFQSLLLELERHSKTRLEARLD